MSTRVRASMRLDLRTILLLPALALTVACGGDGGRARAAETASATGVTTGDTAFGGDTALVPDAATATATGQQGASGRPVAAAVGAAATATATASPGSSAASPTGASVTATATAVEPGTATPAAPTADLAPSTATRAPAQEPAPTTPPASAAPAASSARRRADVPFAVNERLEYDVKFGALDVGDAAMQVNGIETVRGRETYHTVFRVSGGTLFFKVNDRYESWIDTRTMSSHRHVQQIDEGNYERERTFEIYHDRGVYQENQKPEQKTVAEPLDDGSFFYFVRTIPLEVGKTYTFERYFKPDRNPVTIKVVRKEKVRVPAGSYDAIVIQPLIKTKGIFGEGGRAEIWLADDSTRAMLQMKSQLKFGSLNLYLKKYRAGQRP